MYTNSFYPWGFPGGSVVKNPPPVPEMQAGSRSEEEPLEEGMAPLSSVLT